MTTRVDPPSVADEMAKFSGFAVNDGETVTENTPENLNPVSGNATPAEEKQRKATEEAEKVAAKAVKDEEPEGEAASEAEEPAAAASETEKTEEEAEEEPEDDDSKMISMAEAKKLAGKRINERTRELKQAERERDAERRRNDSLEQRLAAIENGKLTSKDSSATIPSNAAPKPEDFEYGELDSRFIRELARYEVRQELQAERNTQQTERQRASAAQEATEFAEAKTTLVETGTAKYDDFDDVVLDNAYSEDNPGGWPLSETLGKLVMRSDVGADIVYHLATHVKEARQVYGKSPVEQAAYFGRLEAKFSTSSSSDAATQDKPAVKTTKAPTPIRSARGIGGSNSVAGDTLDFKAFEAAAMRRT